MASESEKCVDELLLKLKTLDYYLEEFEKDGNDDDDLVSKSRRTISETQAFIDNHKSLIPSYCLKKTADSLRKLETRINKPQKTKLQFKFKSKQQPSSTTEVTLNSSSLCSEPEKIVLDKVEGRSAFSQLPFGFENKINQQLQLESEEVESKDISLVNLEKCSVLINGYANTVYIRDLKETSVVVFLACRAITVTNCKNCKFKFVCQQLRINSTTDTRFEIFTSARSMLESSDNLEFKALYLDQLSEGGMSLESVKSLFKRAKFDVTQNNWKCIDDFDWLSPDVPSKNYSLID